MEARARSSPQQFLALLEFMETNGDITRPQQALQGRVKSHNLWLDLSYLLNSVGGGVTKTPDRWKKVWVDWKNKTKKKALAIRKHSRGTGGGPKIPLILSDLEQRLLAIIGQMAVEGDEEVEEQGLVFDMPSSASQDSQGIQQYHMDVSLDDHNYYEYIDFPGQSPSPSTGMDLLLPPTPPSPTPPPPPPPPPTPPPSTPPPSTASTSAPLVLRLPRSALTATPPSQPSVRSTSGFGALHAAPVPSTSDTSALHTITARPMPPRSASRPTSARSISARPSSQQQRVPTLCSTPSRQRRQRIRTETPFDRAASEFVAIEQRRIKLDEDRERIETRRVEVEAQRVKVIEDRNAILSRFADIAQAWVNK